MRLYGKYMLILLKCQMQYKTSFILTAIGQFLSSFSAFLGIYFMMTRFNAVNGFTLEEVMLCFAAVLMAFSLAECFFRGFDTFSTIISNGEFDRILVRPRNEIFQVLASKMEFTRIGRLFQAVLVFCYAIPASGIHWTFDKIATLILMIVGGIGVFCGLFIIYATLCFFTTEGLEVINILTDGGREFGKYPLSVYGKGILKFFTYAVPHALFQYYPLLYLTDRSDSKLYMLLPLLALGFLIPCLIIWKIGVRHYRSTGS